jgi:F-type H+-transporting ATPase subunit epsilon
MAAATLALAVVTPQRQVLETQARWVDIPAASGQMRALPEHAPTLGELGAGAVRYETAAGAEQSFTVSGGFFEVLGDRVTLLADSAG